MRQSSCLFFTTNCEAAFAFYEQCGLGKGTILLRWGDRGMPVRTESMRGKVLQARFEGPGVLFFASDNDDAEPMKGSALILEFDDPARMRAMFSRMAERASVTVPLARMYWGADFGMMVDDFGVRGCSSRLPRERGGRARPNDVPIAEYVVWSHRNSVLAGRYSSCGREYLVPMPEYSR
jgi:PhnB protein